MPGPICRSSAGRFQDQDRPGKSPPNARDAKKRIIFNATPLPLIASALAVGVLVLLLLLVTGNIDHNRKSKTLHTSVFTAYVAGLSCQQFMSAFQDWSLPSKVCATSEKLIVTKVHPSFVNAYRRLSGGSGHFAEGFVSYVSGSKYLQLGLVAYDAAIKFSHRPIMLFVTPDTLSPSAIAALLRTERIVVFQLESTALHPWFDKLRAAILAPVKAGVMLEADTIITPHANRLFNILKQPHTMPLSPGHPDVRLPHCRSYTTPNGKTCTNPLPYPEYKRSMDYIHAHLIWTSAARQFLIKTLLRCIDGNSEHCSSDEAALNVAYWEANATQQLCLMDPYHGYIAAWDNLDWYGQPEWDRHELAQFTNRTVAFMFLHGAKDVHTARQLVDKIERITQAGKPWISLKGNKWVHNYDTGSHDCVL